MIVARGRAHLPLTHLRLLRVTIKYLMPPPIYSNVEHQLTWNLWLSWAISTTSSRSHYRLSFRQVPTFRPKPWRLYDRCLAQLTPCHLLQLRSSPSASSCFRPVRALLTSSWPSVGRVRILCGRSQSDKLNGPPRAISTRQSAFMHAAVITYQLDSSLSPV